MAGGAGVRQISQRRTGGRPYGIPSLPGTGLFGVPGRIGAAAVQALVKQQAEPGLWLMDVPEPAVGPGDVLIRVLRTGICGTDLHIRAWDGWARQTISTPLVIGHEFVGEVVETGRDVADIKAGELVSGEGHLVCGRCRNCLAGRRHLCRATWI